MSKKGKDTPTSTRIRENQRRSRMRRMELITSLQERVRVYEANGVQATQEMQCAARKVAWENVRLRALLARKGVGEEEVDEFLQDGDEAGKRETVRESEHAKLVDDVAIEAAGAMNIDRSGQHQHTTETTQPAIVPCLVPRPLPDAALSGTMPECPNTAECFCPPATTAITTSEPFSNFGLDISCEAAATIIAEMRGENEGDRAAVRAALGCRGEEECRVRNSEVLGILGER